MSALQHSKTNNKKVLGDFVRILWVVCVCKNLFSGFNAGKYVFFTEILAYSVEMLYLCIRNDNIQLTYY